VFESILGDVFIEGKDIVEGSQFSGNFATSDIGVNGGLRGMRRQPPRSRATLGCTIRFLAG